MNRNGFDDFDLFVSCEEYYDDSCSWEIEDESLWEEIWSTEE